MRIYQARKATLKHFPYPCEEGVFFFLCLMDAERTIAVLDNYLPPEFIWGH